MAYLKVSIAAQQSDREVVDMARFMCIIEPADCELSMLQVSN